MRAQRGLLQGRRPREQVPLPGGDRPVGLGHHPRRRALVDEELSRPTVGWIAGTIWMALRPGADDRDRLAGQVGTRDPSAPSGRPCPGRSTSPGMSGSGRAAQRTRRPDDDVRRYARRVGRRQLPPARPLVQPSPATRLPKPDVRPDAVPVRAVLEVREISGCGEKPCVQRGRARTRTSTGATARRTRSPGRCCRARSRRLASARSRMTKSVRPACFRRMAVPSPAKPAPMIATCTCVGSGWMPGGVSVLASRMTQMLPKSNSQLK